VEVGRLEIVIFMMVVLMPMVMVMVIAFQEQCRHEVDNQANDRHTDGLVKADFLRLDDAVDRFNRHEQRHHAKRNRTGKTTEHADLSGAETKARILRVLAGIAIGEELKMNPATISMTIVMMVSASTM